MPRSTPNSAVLPVAVPLVATVAFFGWGLVATSSGCDSRTYDDGVDSWAFLGVFTALMYCIFAAALLALRLVGWLALVATAITVLAVALGAQVGWAIGMALTGCRWDEGPALTLSLFATPGALFGFVCGWFLRKAKERNEE